MKREQKHASVVAALIIGAGAALALTSASVALWLAAGAAVGVVVAAVLNNLVGDPRPSEDRDHDHRKLRASS